MEKKFMGGIGLQTTADTIGLEDLIRAMARYFGEKLGETPEQTEAGIREVLNSAEVGNK